MKKEQAIEEAKLHVDAQSRGFLLLQLLTGGDETFSWCISREPIPANHRIVERVIWDEDRRSWACLPIMRTREDWNSIPRLSEQAEPYLNMPALREVDWPALYMPSGEDPAMIPSTMCALVLPDPVLRKLALQVLRGIELNGCIGSVTRFSVPFLLQLVIDPAIAERAAILDILLAVAQAEHYQPGAISIHPLTEEDDIDPQLQQEAQAAYHQIGVFISYFARMLSEPDPLIRRLAGTILDCFPGHEVDTWTPLEQAFQQEQDELIQATFLHDLCCLTPLDSAVLWLERIRQNHPSQLTRLVASLRIPYFSEHETPDDVVDALISYLDSEPELLRQRYEAIPDETFGHFYADIVQSLEQCSVPARLRAVPVLLRLYRIACQRSDSYHRLKTYFLAEKLVQFAFPLSTKEEPLTPLQQDIIKALCADDRPWRIWHWGQMLKQHKLPDTREALFHLAR